MLKIKKRSPKLLKLGSLFFVILFADITIALKDLINAFDVPANFNLIYYLIGWIIGYGIPDLVSFSIYLFSGLLLIYLWNDTYWLMKFTLIFIVLYFFSYTSDILFYIPYYAGMIQESSKGVMCSVPFSWARVSLSEKIIHCIIIFVVVAVIVSFSLIFKKHIIDFWRYIIK